MDENHCRVLGTYSRPGLDIELTSCYVTNIGTHALAEALGRNQGPTKLDDCSMDSSVLADGLRGSSRLKSLRLSLRVGSREVLAFADALKENKGLVDLNLMYGLLSDEAWDAICDSLKTHPTLQTLDLLPMKTYVMRRPQRYSTPGYRHS
jgi:hypothetical protein